MYSYADRISAVELYIKLGLRVRATIRQLGQPFRLIQQMLHAQIAAPIRYQA